HFTMTDVPPDPIAAAVKLLPPPPDISVMMPPEALKAWSFVPALTLLNTTVENTGRMDKRPSTIHSAVAPIEVVLGGLVMPILVAWLVVLFSMEQKPWLAGGAQTSTVR